MTVDELVLTRDGYRQLQAELEQLRTVRLPETTARLRQALELAGDLGDNPEYLEAVRERESVEQRVAVLEARLGSARVLDPNRPSSASVVLGSAAELEDVDTGERSSYRLVNSAEANPSEGRLSIESPVGAAITGHRPGETVEVATPRGRRHLRIVAVGR